MRGVNLMDTHAPASVVLIRLLTGGVFLSEGIQKFRFPETPGAGRFAAIGSLTRDSPLPSSAASRFWAGFCTCRAI